MADALIVQKAVLDHGYVRLEDWMGSDHSIVRSARVSYGRDSSVEIGTRVDEKDAKLIHYLMKNRHSTPFEAVTFTFEVKAPIFVFRQWHRHRTQSYNEVSARYTVLPTEFYVPKVEHITQQSTGDKQQRTNERHPHAATIQRLLEDQARASFGTYAQLTELGCPRELARAILPVSTYSRMYCTMNLHNLFHFLKLRLGSHAQYEIRVYAEAMLELIEPIVPAAVAAFKEHQL